MTGETARTARDGRRAADQQEGAQSAFRPPAAFGRALVVDDDPAWRQILAEILADSGLEVDVAAGLEEASERLRESPHRLAVVDLSLSGAGPQNQEGLEVLQAVRRQDPGCASILLTGFATVEIAVKALSDYAAYTCIQKDAFRRGQFREIVNRVLASAPAEPPSPATEVAPHLELPPALAAGREKSGLPAVLLVEDEAGWRSSLAQMLSEAGYRVRACPSFGEAIGYLRRGRFVLAVVDLSLASSISPSKNRDGWQMLARTGAAGIPAIVVSGSAAPADAERAYAEHGIFAYIEKQSFSSGTFTRLAGEAIAAGGPPQAEMAQLTLRERDVLELLAQGLTNKEIAAKLVISTNTVKRYLKSIFEKLAVDTRAAAAAKATTAGIAFRSRQTDSRSEKKKAAG